MIGGSSSPTRVGPGRVNPPTTGRPSCSCANSATTTLVVLGSPSERVIGNPASGHGGRPLTVSGQAGRWRATSSSGAPMASNRCSLHRHRRRVLTSVVRARSIGDPGTGGGRSADRAEPRTAASRGRSDASVLRRRLRRAILSRLADVVQWQNIGFPRDTRGFDSLIRSGGNAHLLSDTQSGLGGGATDNHGRRGTFQAVIRVVRCDRDQLRRLLSSALPAPGCAGRVDGRGARRRS